MDDVLFIGLSIRVLEAGVLRMTASGIFQLFYLVVLIAR